ncbi:LysR family transcriptional regulator [Paenibacillus pinistramenti]|uniref:LysR family transcriptional regulator n=1 Tax=Paenibacillus pinistramenti TaxID=1768003 RepID=UPI0011096A28|nr:LysR family transcriptional regulator [Paenibacillus pinistramenti]
MNIDHIEAFIYIHHYGSFNKAADILFISQPTVTARIQSLERELDCRLFDRLGKQIQLTEEGRQFLPYAQQILQTYQKGKHHLRSDKSLPGELRIGSTASVSNYLMPALLSGLHRKFPETKFKLVTAPTDVLAAKLAARELDLAFVRKIVNPSFQSYSFLKDPIRLYVYKNHPLASAKSASIQDISQEKLIFFECGSLDWMSIQRAFESLKQPPDILYQVDNSETAKKLVLSEAGIAFLPGVSVRQEVESGELIPVDIAETAGIALQTSLISLNGEHLPVIQTLLELGEELNLAPI